MLLYFLFNLSSPFLFSRRPAACEQQFWFPVCAERGDIDNTHASAGDGWQFLALHYSRASSRLKALVIRHALDGLARRGDFLSEGRRPELIHEALLPRYLAAFPHRQAKDHRRNALLF